MSITMKTYYYHYLAPAQPAAPASGYGAAAAPVCRTEYENQCTTVNENECQTVQDQVRTNYEALFQFENMKLF